MYHIHIESQEEHRLMDTQTVRCEVQDYIALVTMDRPPVNAVNAQLHDEEYDG